MKIFRIIRWVVFVAILLVLGLGVWLCTGSFTYQSSMHKEFVIDEPIMVVCRRAMNIKPKPEAEGLRLPKIDMQEAAKNYSLGQPIEVELEHPKLGTIKAGIQINLELEPNALKIRGRVVTLEPSHFEKFGKSLADVENFTFELKITTQDGSGNDLGAMGFLASSARTFLLGGDSGAGKTVLELTTNSDVLVHFRGLGFMRAQVDRMISKEQEDIIQQIEAFLDENLRNPGEEELARQNPEEGKPQPGWGFLTRQRQGAQPQVPQGPQQKAAPEEVPEPEDEEDPDVSALDEEI